jgi:hypothetical protein
MTDPNLNYTFSNKMGSAARAQHQQNAANAQNEWYAAQQAQAYANAYNNPFNSSQYRFDHSYAGAQQQQQPIKPISLPSSHWSIILGVSPTATVGEINKAYRLKAKTTHSDHGGSDAAMSRLNVARDVALKERKF